MSQKTSDKILVQAKINFTLKGGAFLSTIFYSMETQYSDEIDTACTDGKHILINKDININLLSDIVNSKFETSIKGNKKKLLDMAYNNAKISCVFVANILKYYNVINNSKGGTL